MTLAIDEAEAFHRVKIRALGIVTPHRDRADALSSISCSARIDGKEGEDKKMTLLERRPRRRQLLRAGAAAAGALLLPGRRSSRPPAWSSEAKSHFADATLITG
jgi:hypothetical protein